jgi:signal transduction histidine kinase/CheY-like chemotaxis protein
MKITQRLVVLFLIVSLSFCAIILLYFQIKKQEGRIYGEADALQRKQIINAFIEIKKNNVMRLIDEHSMDDAMANFTASKSAAWAESNLKPLLAANNLDIIQIYDTTGVSIFTASSNIDPQLRGFTFPKEFFSTIKTEKRKYFTEPWQQQYMQVGASTIHSSADTTRTESPLGYIVAAKLWDTTYLEDFSQTLEYNVRLFYSEPPAQPPHTTFNVNISIPLAGWNNIPVAWLLFRSTNPFISQWQALGKNIILGFLIFTLAFLLVQFTLLYNWINSPLKQISNSLKYGNPELIHPLSETNNEFGEIARLIKLFFEQNQQLRNEMEERRKTEMMLRQAQKMESIGTLAGGIAHDFNNIITIISGYIALASGKMYADHRDIRNNLDEAMRACLRAQKLIEKILTFSRQTEKSVQPVLMAALVEDTMELLSHTIPSSITIKTDLHSDACVLADPTEMQQVVMNIASNSYHAMRYQGGAIKVEMFEMEGRLVHAIVPNADIKQKYICLAFQDTGSGIPQEILDRIFDPYFSTKAPGEGTGLGLSIVHGIVTGSGGYIHISSILEHGTTVKVFLPTTTLRFAEKAITESDLKFVPAKLYFVDDEPALTELFKETLTDAGYDVAGFTDSSLAYKQFEENSSSCDILVADIAMPGLNGIQLAQKFRAINPDLPIILYSGYSDNTIQRSCREMGINKLMVKPVLPDTLSLTVKQILTEKKLKF